MKSIFKSLVLTTSIFTSLALQAQDLESLVNAEKAFAKTSIEKSVRTAFLEFFDRNTIAFTNGQPILGKKDWERRKENNNYLYWWPVYADIAASGDFGFTTGPAVYGPDRDTKEAKGGLYYSSVWKKDINGNWKVLADLGSAVYNPNDSAIPFKTSSHQPHPVNDLGAEAKRELIALDKSYNEELNKAKSSSFDQSYFSDEARVHRRNIAPLTTPQAIAGLNEDNGFSFDHYEGHVASSNDMAFTYGTVKIITNKEGKDAVELACYMRVWKVENGEWSIVLDVID